MQEPISSNQNSYIQNNQQQTFPNDKNAKWSLILGLFSVVCTCLTGIPAVVLGIMALSDSQKISKSGRTNAIIGIVLGALGSLFIIIVFIKGQYQNNNQPSQIIQVPQSQKSQQYEPTQPIQQLVQKVPNYNYSVNTNGKKLYGKIASQVGVAIISIKRQRTLGNNFSNQTSDGEFLVLELAVTNNQNDRIMFDSNLLEIVDDQGRIYSYSPEGQTALMMSGRESLFLKSLNPGITTTGLVVFDIPPNLSNNQLKLKFRGGMMGSEEELPIELIETP